MVDSQTTGTPRQMTTQTPQTGGNTTQPAPGAVTPPATQQSTQQPDGPAQPASSRGRRPMTSGSK